jgi:hypothetical protein
MSLTAREYRLRRYKLTPEEQDKIKAEQNNGCAICHRDFATYTAFQDHYHHKGCGGSAKQLCGLCLRGMLCFNCNKYCVGTIERMSIACKKIPPATLLKSMLAYFEKWEPMMKERDAEDAKVKKTKRVRKSKNL